METNMHIFVENTLRTQMLQGYRQYSWKILGQMIPAAVHLEWTSSHLLQVSRGGEVLSTGNMNAVSFRNTIWAQAGAQQGSYRDNMSRYI